MLVWFKEIGQNKFWSIILSIFLCIIALISDIHDIRVEQYLNNLIMLHVDIFTIHLFCQSLIRFFLHIQINVRYVYVQEKLVFSMIYFYKYNFSLTLILRTCFTSTSGIIFVKIQQCKIVSMSFWYIQIAATEIR